MRKLWIIAVVFVALVVLAQQPFVNNALTDVWDAVNHRLKVDGSGVTQPVSGTFWQATQPVSGTFFQATQPVSNAGTFAAQAQPTPVTSGGLITTNCAIQSAASTNSTNCKNAAGQIYHIEVINTTSTLYYLRLYDASSAPTCSSATGFKRSIPVPHNTGNGAGFEAEYGMGESYATGIGFCLTGGGSSTDNTNAATGLYVTVFYK